MQLIKYQKGDKIIATGKDGHPRRGKVLSHVKTSAGVTYNCELDVNGHCVFRSHKEAELKAAS